MIALKERYTTLATLPEGVMGNFKLEPVDQIRRDPFIIGWMISIHLLAMLAPLTYSPGAVGICLLLYFVTGCLGITLGFHRLLTHRSLKASPWLEGFLATCGVLALQGSPLEWVAHHRMHHAGSDTPQDPHDASRGFWYSHMGWLFHKNPNVDDVGKLRKFGRDISADPYLTFLSRPAVMIGLQVALGILLLSLGGIGWVIWGIFLRLVIVYHVTWFVNSAAHMWGYQTYETESLATNNWWVGLLAFGEGWHNNHHAQPDAIHVHRQWWEFDLTWQVVRLLRSMGLVSQLKLPLSKALASTRDLETISSI